MQIPFAIVSALLALSAGVGCAGSVDDHVSLPRGADAATADANGLIVGTADSSDGSDEADAIADQASSDTTCSILQTIPAPARSAVSAGFTGTDTQYRSLYNVACQTVSDCATACVLAGGSMASCTNASACVEQGLDGGMTCLPPTYWLMVGGALSESGMTANAAQQILVSIPYNDAILLSNFSVSIPDDAVITGIQFQVRHASLASLAVDDSVQILQNGTPVGANHGKSGAWPGTLTYVDYGGANDLWGVSWTAADVRANGFGISIAAKYTSTGGNERAYIDSVRVTIFYSRPALDGGCSDQVAGD